MDVIGQCVTDVQDLCLDEDEGYMVISILDKKNSFKFKIFSKLKIQKFTDLPSYTDTEFEKKKTQKTLQDINLKYWYSK